MFASYSALKPGPAIVTLARGESLSEPSSSLTLLSTINFPQQASWCPALRGKPRLLQAEPSPLVKVGCAVCTGGSQVPGPRHQPSPRARVTATGGGAKHAAFTPSISSLPDNFCTIHPGPLPRKFQFSSDTVKRASEELFPLQNIVTHYFASYTAYYGCKRMKEIRSGLCHRPTICILIS